MINWKDDACVRCCWLFGVDSSSHPVISLSQIYPTPTQTQPPTNPHSSFAWHVAYGLFMFTIAVFNGANYYIEVSQSARATMPTAFTS